LSKTCGFVDWIEGKEITEAEAKKLAKPDLCADKIVTIEGKQYKLTPVTVK
jgi:hypothetical protein